MVWVGKEENHWAHKMECVSWLLRIWVDALGLALSEIESLQELFAFLKAALFDWMRFVWEIGETKGE